jgi:hypothetical protein
MRRLILLFSLFIVAACSALPVEPDGPLVVVSTRGGECPEGMCTSRTVIERDGRVHRTEPDAMDVGRIPADTARALDAAIRSTDFELLRSRPFTGECPVNFDGQELIYEFSAPNGVERLASCEVEIDPAHPLFSAVEAALAGG